MKFWKNFQASKYEIIQNWYYEPGFENEILHEVRIKELCNKAPFSDKFVFLDRGKFFHDDVTLQPNKIASPSVLGNVPIREIVGFANMYRNDFYFNEGATTFRDLLYQYLHGASFIEESCSYLAGEAVKHPNFENYVPFPQKEDSKIKECGFYAKKGIEFSKRRGGYFAIQGQQRALFAMYVIFQKHGINGELKNVLIGD